MEIRKFSAAALVAIAMVALSGACSSDGAGSGGSGKPSLSISRPAAGSTVTLPFTVQFTSNEQLGATSTGLDHVHLYFDDHSDRYLIVESTSVQVTDAPAGQHVMHLSLRNANHSPAGAEAQLTLTINGGSANPSATPSGVASAAPTPSSDGGGGGYGY